VKNPIISIIVLSYNHEKYLARCLDSIVEQKISFPFEIIIGDDSSKDQTLLVIESYQKKYPMILNSVKQVVNVGTTLNLMAVVKECKGEYLVLVAGDDYWIDFQKLQKQYDWLTEHPDYLAVGNCIVAKNELNETLDTFPIVEMRGKDVTINQFLNADFYPLSGLMFKNIFKDVRDYQLYSDLITQSRLIEDFTLCLILLNTGKIHILDQTLAVYNYRDNPQESNYNSLTTYKQKYIDQIKLYQFNEKFYRGKFNFAKLYFKAVVSLLGNAKQSRSYKMVFLVFLVPIKHFPYIMYSLLRIMLRKI
jgi:glycosyltransferase involved in cell wall biosynthesis